MMKNRVSWWSIALYYTMLAGSFGFLAWCVSQPVRAHDWYPYGCCGGHDCSEATITPIPETHELVITNKFNTVRVPEAAIKPQPSPDGQTHACIVNTQRGPTLWCLWLAPGM